MITHYLHISIAIGLGQIIDAVHLHRVQGRVTRFALIFSLVEYVWAAVSGWVFFKQGSDAPHPVWYPAFFLSYVVVMSIWGMVFACKTDCENPEDLQVPPFVAQTGGIFGILFTVLGIGLLVSS